MANTLDTTVAMVRDALAGRRVVWFGIRGEDGEALLQLPELEASYSIIAPMRSGQVAPTSNLALEDLTGTRPDLDRYDIDLDPNEHTREFRRRLLAEVSGRCVLVTYRPSALVSALAFSMADTLLLAGPLKDRQSAFEHKPWVERELVRRGVPGLGWRYVADEHRSRARRLVADRPHILRASRTSGGVGIALVRDAGEVDRHWPEQPESFVAVAPYLEAATPVNLSACVFADGTVRVHPPSVQLIGIASCTMRPFGYCGNDFGAVAALGENVLEQLDDMARTVGAWLHEERYRGVFGLDALVADGIAHFTEINARFQGSSAMSAEIAGELDEPDLFLDHLAAMLSLPAADGGLSVAQWAARQPARSHVVVHNTDDVPLVRSRENALPREPALRLAQQPGEALRIAPGGILARLLWDGSVTGTGFELFETAERTVTAVRRSFRRTAD